jgi:hypothetical protein
MPTSISPIWNFNLKNSFSKGRDPVQGEFFNDEDIKDVSVALIRESFQNSLDSNVEVKIRIRVTVSGKQSALSENVAAKYFSSYWDHLKSAYPDFTAEISEMARKPCEFVVIEDFGTTGLTGDEKAEDEPSNKKNDFFYFFRAEGKSGKSGNDKGRWGIGKYVFPKSSGAKAFFALTIRHGDVENRGPMLMGQAVIKGHKIDQASFEPDGWFASRGQRVWEPFNSSELIDEFKSDWQITRTNQSGLSVVVPYIEDVNEHDIFRSVIEEYMLVILRDELEVELVGSNGVTNVLNSHTLRAEAARIFDGREEKNEVLSNLDALAWGLAVPADEIILLNQVDNSPEWNPERMTEELAAVIRERTESAGKAFVRIPVQIHVNKRDGIPAHDENSHFDVIFATSSGSLRPQFIREGIKVSGVNGGTISSLRAITLIDDGVLATLLGDSEGPAHTDWSKSGEKLGKKYKYAAKWIDFVKRTPQRIIETARGSDREGDRSIAAGWFPDVQAGRTPATGIVQGESSDENTTKPIVDIPEPIKRKVRTSELVDGFSVTLTEHGKDVKAIECVCAYEIRKGNPFSKWTKDDFNLKKMPVELTGGLLTKRDGNIVVVEITDPSIFIMNIRGFDTNRDVTVSTRVATL